MADRHYKNFKTVVYIPAQVAESFTPEKLAGDYDFLEKYYTADVILSPGVFRKYTAI